MKKFSQVLNSPLRIGIFALCIVLVVSAIAFASIQAGANVNVNKTIGLDKGVEVALVDAGFKAEQVTNLTAHYDNEDGMASYEVEFSANGFEYDYVIKAADGTILESKRESKKAPVLSEKEIKFEDPLPAETPKIPTSQSSQNSQTSSSPSSKYVGVDEAKSVALKDAGVSSSEATFTKAKLDKDDGRAVYEIEFFAGNTEYEYEINATSGKIIDKDFDRDDDYGDDDYDDRYDWDD